MASSEGLQKAGQVNIEQLKLINGTDIITDLTEFIVELNIFEDIFSNYLYGNIILTDSRNLIEKLNIHGEEFLNVKLRTPSFSDKDVIEKTFRIYKLTDREIVRDTNTQTYTLHFVSIEVFYDVLLPLFVPFEGDMVDVVADIFSNYVASSRNFNTSENETIVTENEKVTELIIMDEASNKVKFISPGWTAFKCINWLATKSLPKTTTAANFIFFESNKNFYFGTLENLFKDASLNNNYIGRYHIAASNIRSDDGTTDVNREMFLAQDVIMSETADYIKNYTNGYLGSRLIYLDMYNKEYQQIDYDHVSNYKNQFHISGPGSTAIPTFSQETFVNFASSISFYPKNPKLFNDFPDNISEKMGQIHGNRLSSMLELTNIKMVMTVPGRTDVEIGRILYFDYPALGPKDATDKVLGAQDKQYSGYYFITAIHHKINKNEHKMTMEVVKDSLYVDVDSNSKG